MTLTGTKVTEDQAMVFYFRVQSIVSSEYFRGFPSPNFSAGAFFGSHNSMKLWSFRDRRGQWTFGPISWATFNFSSRFWKLNSCVLIFVRSFGLLTSIASCLGQGSFASVQYLQSQSGSLGTTIPQTICNNKFYLISCLVMAFFLLGFKLFYLIASLP